MRQAQLSAGTVEYEDSGGDGPVLVFLTGAFVGVTRIALQTLRVRGLRRAPATFGQMSKRPVPDHIMDAWLAPSLIPEDQPQACATHIRTFVASC